MTSPKAPRTTEVAGEIQPVAAGADLTTVLGRVPEDGVVGAVTFSPAAAIAGATTNTRTLTLVNKGQDGTGNTAVAALALVSGVNPAAADEYAFTLSGTPANLNVAAGDILEVTSAHASSGLADPGGFVRVTIGRG